MDRSDATSSPRSPRLTTKLLTEDLPEAIRELDDGVAYLASRLQDDGVGKLSEKLRERFQTRLERLQRSRAWLAGKVAAETSHRGPGAALAPQGVLHG